MSKAFKKGQAVIEIGSWDGKGCFYWRRAIVQSCGMKQMTLSNAATGEMLGNHYRPVEGVDIDAGYSYGTVPDMSDEQVTALALELAAKYNAREIMCCELQIADAKTRIPGSRYIAIREADLVALKAMTFSTIQR